MQLTTYNEEASAVMPADFDEAVEIVDNLLREGNKVALVYAWKIGEIVSAVQKDEGVYGSKAVDRIAEKVGKTPRLLQEMLRFYSAFPNKEKVGELEIEWSSAREVLRLPEPDIRESVIAEATERQLTVREVRELVNKVSADPKSPAARTRAVSAKSWFRRMRKMLETNMEAVKKHMEGYPEAAHTAVDESKTSEEDYDLIVHGDIDNEALIVDISDLAIRLSAYLTSQVQPIRNGFDDNEEPK